MPLRSTSPAKAAQAEAAGDLEQAVAHWRSLLQLDPKRLPARREVERLNRLVADHLLRQGETALAAGRETEALTPGGALRPPHPRRCSPHACGRSRPSGICGPVSHSMVSSGSRRRPSKFRKVLALQPNHPEALRYLAYIGSGGPQSLLSERFSRLE